MPIGRALRLIMAAQIEVLAAQSNAKYLIYLKLGRIFLYLVSQQTKRG